MILSSSDIQVSFHPTERFTFAETRNPSIDMCHALVQKRQLTHFWKTFVGQFPRNEGSAFYLFLELGITMSTDLSTSHFAERESAVYFSSNQQLIQLSTQQLRTHDNLQINTSSSSSARQGFSLLLRILGCKKICQKKYRVLQRSS